MKARRRRCTWCLHWEAEVKWANEHGTVLPFEHRSKLVRHLTRMNSKNNRLSHYDGNRSCQVH